MDTTTPETASPKRAGKYFVKCDDCRETMRYTDSVSESAAGGRCEKCRAEATKAAERIAKSHIIAAYKSPRAYLASPAARELAAYEADIYKAKRNARVAKKGGLR